MPTTPAVADRALAPRAAAARVTALLLALAWSTVGFATTDLWVVIPPAHPRFAGENAMLEAGWGATLTCLVVVPLLAAVLVPRVARAVAAQPSVVAGCTVPVAALSLDAAFLLFGAALGMTAAVAAWASRAARDRPADARRLTAIWAVATLVLFVGVPWAGFMRTSGDAYPAGSRNGAVLLLATVAAAWVLAFLVRRDDGTGRRPRGAALALLAVVAAGAAPWLAYVLHLSAVARGVHEPYVTNGVDHWPQQAAAALAVLALPALAVAGRGSVRLAGWSSGLAGVGLGGFSLLYPDASASLGAAWGTAAALWGLAVVVTALAVRPCAAQLALVRAPRTPGARIVT